MSTAPVGRPPPAAPVPPRSASAGKKSSSGKSKKEPGKRRSKSQGQGRRRKPAHGRSVTSSSASGSGAASEVGESKRAGGGGGGGRAAGPGGDHVDDSDMCVICQQDIDVRLDCAMLDCCPHIFHYTCIRKWSGVKSSCPSCRKPFLNIEKVDVEDQREAIVPLSPAEAMARPRLGASERARRRGCARDRSHTAVLMCLVDARACAGTGFAVGYQFVWTVLQTFQFDEDMLRDLAFSGALVRTRARRSLCVTVSSTPLPSSLAAHTSTHARRRSSR